MLPTCTNGTLQTHPSWATPSFEGPTDFSRPCRKPSLQLSTRPFPPSFLTLPSKCYYLSLSDVSRAQRGKKNSTHKSIPTLVTFYVRVCVYNPRDYIYFLRVNNSCTSAASYWGFTTTTSTYANGSFQCKNLESQANTRIGTIWRLITHTSIMPLQFPIRWEAFRICTWIGGKHLILDRSWRGMQPFGRPSTRDRRPTPPRLLQPWRPRPRLQPQLPVATT